MISSSAGFQKTAFETPFENGCGREKPLACGRGVEKRTGA
jgi:hypothetical protein